MGRSRLRYLKARAVASQGDLPSVIIRLMLAMNDIALAADANDMWAETEEQRRAYRKRFARMYFIRLIMSHVHEALKTVDEINRSAALKAAVGKCDARTQDNFNKLVAILNSPERGQLFRFRNKATFHYDKDVSGEHLRAVVAHDPAAFWAYSAGSTALDWHFELGDAVMNRMVVRFVFGTDEARSPARSEKVEKIATRLQEISMLFTEFAASFVERHLG